MASPSKDSEAEVRSWGFRNVFTWTDGPHAYYRPHTHAGLTTHLILRGQLTIAYPDDIAGIADTTDTTDTAAKTTYGVGERLDVPAGKSHEVWVGPEGCTYVIGE